MTKIKITYLCFHHGNACYSAIPFYCILSIVKLLFLDGDTYFTRVAWDTPPRKLKVVPFTTKKRTPVLKP